MEKKNEKMEIKQTDDADGHSARQRDAMRCGGEDVLCYGANKAEGSEGASICTAVGKAAVAHSQHLSSWLPKKGR